MEIVAAAAAGKGTISAITHVHSEFRYLQREIENLTAIKSDVQTLIDAALRNGELIKSLVKDWMTRTDGILVQAAELSHEARVINGWFRGWYYRRFSLGRKAQNTIKAIQKIYEEGCGFGSSVSFPKPTIVGTKEFITFASRDGVTEEIRQALLDDETNLIGVYGMPGVGKTVLIREIAKKVKQEGLFQEVVMVTVSQCPSLSKLQEDIAEVLDLFHTKVNLSRRAERLSDRLNKDDKTTLIILDDVWERIELSDVGIPYRNRGKFCKVVFTTRAPGVCDRMEANAKFEVALLSEKDSWSLFKQKSEIEEDSSLALDLLKECKGLPLLIVTLAQALRGKDAIVWADLLKQLQRSIFEGMNPVVFSSIKLSYDFLESESVQICFLFCCLFPEDHKIELDVLLFYLMGEKLLEDVHTYDEARGRLHSLVDNIVSSGLLLRDKDGDLTMNDVVRDAALSIAVKKKGFIVKAGRGLTQWPYMELVDCVRLSLMHNPIKNLPTIPIKAPHLRSLFLNDNRKLTELPPDFFADMKCLVTLDLSRTKLRSLPPSLSCLQNLHTLLLIDTRLIILSPIDMLERLEVLALGVFTDIISKLQLSKKFHLLSDVPSITEIRETWSQWTVQSLIQNLRTLESLSVQYCHNLLNVLQKEDEEEEESLLSNMSNISEPLPCPIFHNLKRLKLDWTKIRYVFTMKLARYLRYLEQLEIIDCQEMEVLFKYANGDNIKCEDSDVLPFLKKLTIWRAPKLKSFTSRNLLMKLVSLEILEVWGCGILERLPFGTASVPRLQTFKVFSGVEFFDQLEWEDESVKARLLLLTVNPFEESKKLHMKNLKVAKGKEVQQSYVETNRRTAPSTSSSSASYAI